MLHSAMDHIMRGLSTSEKVLSQCHRLKDKIAVVTASSQGIGFSIAHRFAQEGAKVIISSRNESNVKSAVEKLRTEGFDVTGITCHVGKSQDREKLLNEAKSRYGRLDILVLNAGINPTFGSLFDCSDSGWDKIFDVNLKCTYFLMKESLPLLNKSKSPSITLVSSIAGYQPLEELGVYCITKTALLSLCKIAAQELAKDGIRVNCIAPGIIETKFSEILCNPGPISEAIFSMIPMKRFGHPDEIGSVAAFLASSDASYITGETIIASGGMKSRL